MEQTALPLASVSQPPPPPSTLAPPPLETAATGTRALQRFDLGRMRAAEAASAPSAASPEEDAPDENAPEEIASAEIASAEIAITVGTVKMSVPAKIKELPLPSDAVSGTMPWPRFEMPAARGAIRKSVRYWPLPPPTPGDTPPFPILREAAWAFAAVASLAVASSVASALVYLIAFP